MPFGYTFGFPFGPGTPHGPLDPLIPAPTTTVIGRLVYVGDHIKRGLARLITEFHDRPRIEGFLAVLLSEVQELENAIWQVAFALDLDGVEGAQLDVIGKIVGLARGAYDDTTYRLLLKVQILVLKSNGQPEDMIAILRLLLGGPSFVYTDEVTGEPATIEVDARGVALPFDIGLFLRTLKRAKAAGVKLRMFYGLVDGDHLFTFTSVEAYPDIDPLKGSADVAQTSGGHLAGIASTTGA